MVNGIRTSDPRGLNKGRGSKFRVGSRVRQETPEEGRWTHQPKRCENNNKDEDNSPKTLNDKNRFVVIFLIETISAFLLRPSFLSFFSVTVVFTATEPVVISTPFNPHFGANMMLFNTASSSATLIYLQSSFFPQLHCVFCYYTTYLYGYICGHIVCIILHHCCSCFRYEPIPGHWILVLHRR